MGIGTVNFVGHGPARYKIYFPKFYFIIHYMSHVSHRWPAAIYGALS